MLGTHGGLRYKELSPLPAHYRFVLVSYQGRSIMNTRKLNKFVARSPTGLWVESHCAHYTNHECSHSIPITMRRQITMRQSIVKQLFFLQVVSIFPLLEQLFKVIAKL